MLYDDDDDNRPSLSRRLRKSPGVITVAALVPACLAGWLIWHSVGGPDGTSAKSPATAETQDSTPSTTPAKPSHPADGDNKQGDDKPGNGAPAGHASLAGKVVVIDPGHNPNNYRHPTEINRRVNIGNGTTECDTTGTSTNNGYAEAQFTLDVSHRLRALLEKQGVKVRLAQNDDHSFGPCVTERAAFGNKAKADAAVSVHADGSSVGHRGFHVILPALVKAGAADTADIVAPSHDLGTRIAGKFVRDTGTAPSNYIGGGTGLDTRGDLGGLNLSTVPKVFIECGNMRDPKDAALLTSGSWRQKAAQGIADGISSFLHAE
ncbi:N-acetylmuramoyl-L-alanine amidase [Streptomyces sp. NBC_00963]|uniref:N-acetylmuramoyl-L-alanine amidase n=1 Tax=Streptomyces sp. NBC_00963 TaxID=2903697 RepID=UPI003867DE3E|nr:N-acetylmuramoyl-L-alanine amidase [Streptomyces sp. NBC_00963]